MIRDTRKKQEEKRCPDPECNSLLLWGKCPNCGREDWWHSYDICPTCGYSGAEFIV